MLWLDFIFSSAAAVGGSYLWFVIAEAIADDAVAVVAMTQQLKVRMEILLFLTDVEMPLNGSPQDFAVY